MEFSPWQCFLWLSRRRKASGYVRTKRFKRRRVGEIPYLVYFSGRLIKPSTRIGHGAHRDATGSQGCATVLVASLSSVGGISCSGTDGNTHGSDHDGVGHRHRSGRKTISTPAGCFGFWIDEYKAGASQLRNIIQGCSLQIWGADRVYQQQAIV